VLTADAGALWVTSTPFAAYTRHAWAGAWVCSLFRRESGPPASELIRAALSASRAALGEPPQLGLVSFVDQRHVRPTMVRGRQVWGWTWLRAGFELAGVTKGGLLAFRVPPERFPEAFPAHPLDDGQASLF